MFNLSDRALLKILSGPTPLESMPQLEKHFKLEPQTLLIKRDDVLFEGIGGNKARKLEFVLGELKEKNITHLVTYGAWGSNHVFITALCAKKFGFKLKAHLSPQPVTDDVKNKLLALQNLGVEKCLHNNSLSLAYVVLKNKKNPSSIYPGASSPLGSLGYVKAAYEAVEQLKEKGWTDKKIKLFVPTGSLGTVAGLLVGLCSTSLAPLFEVHAIQVVPLHWNFGKWGILRLTRKTLNLIEPDPHVRATVQHKIKKMLKWHPFDYRPGYGAASEAVYQTLDLVQELEKISLDITYSGKAMSALLRAIELNSPLKTERFLFWNTFPKVL